MSEIRPVCRHIPVFESSRERCVFAVVKATFIAAALANTPSVVILLNDDGRQGFSVGDANSENENASPPATQGRSAGPDDLPWLCREDEEAQECSCIPRAQD
jgi:hypothetical protein